MSVVVNNLTKSYGDQNAIDDLNFNLKNGEIVGFLGPNGAGKTTTMKIITGYMPATKGNVVVYDHEVDRFPLRTKALIGYLPEHNPLYDDMYVKEYLSFVGNLYGISGLNDRVKEIIQLVGLEKEQHKNIKALSKGYQQRVGLAQAIIHDPKVLVLDEPTSGLDPNQLIEIRDLIKKLGKDKIVLFSSHIMQEVQALCDRVIILNNGKIVADDPINQLILDQSIERKFSVELLEDIKESSFGNIEHLTHFEKIGHCKYVFYAMQDIRVEIFKFAIQHKLILIELKEENANVESVFKELTKK